MNFEKKIIKNKEDIKKGINTLSKNLIKIYPEGDVDLILLNHAPKYFSKDLADSLRIDVRIQKLEFDNYEAKTRSGEVKITKDLEYPICGRNVILTDGIIISGTTHEYLCNILNQRLPKSLAIASIASKPKLLKKNLPPCYTLFHFSDEIIEGYGMGSAELSKKKCLFNVR
tara:strand:+ start:7809 stop:8321 length:513 start_codon:yes stop_codon:yes gene_type:complete